MAGGGLGILNDHGVGVSDWADLEGNTQGTVTSATTAAQSAALTEGVYDIWCDQDTYVAVGTAASTGLTTTTGYLLRQGNTMPVLVRQNSKIGAIMSTATGTLSYFKVR